MTELLSAFAQVLLINIILSGDNAVVIGLAARELEARQRHRAIILGGALAVLLRIIITIPAALILSIPFLRAVGGVVLAWIAYSLLSETPEEVERGGAASMLAAVRMIVVADATMSLDNILAVAAVAERSSHSILVLTVGLALSIPVVLLGGGLVATLMRRLPWLAWVGAAILAYTAADLVTGDLGVQRLVHVTAAEQMAFGAAVTVVVLAAAAVRLVAERRAEQRRQQSTREDYAPLPPTAPHPRDEHRNAHG